MFASHHEVAPKSYCFRCSNGCIHVVCGNIALTLEPLDFLVLAEAINALRQELKQETKSADSPYAYKESLVM